MWYSLLLLWCHCWTCCWTTYWYHLLLLFLNSTSCFCSYWMNTLQINDLNQASWYRSCRLLLLSFFLNQISRVDTDIIEKYGYDSSNSKFYLECDSIWMSSILFFGLSGIEMTGLLCGQHNWNLCAGKILVLSARELLLCSLWVKGFWCFLPGKGFWCFLQGKDLQRLWVLSTRERLWGALCKGNILVLSWLWRLLVVGLDSGLELFYTIWEEEKGKGNLGEWLSYCRRHLFHWIDCWLLLQQLLLPCFFCCRWCLFWFLSFVYRLNGADGDVMVAVLCHRKEREIHSTSFCLLSFPFNYKWKIKE